jgi:transposase
MAGRPTKYTPDRAKRLIDAVRMGASYEIACNYAGISVDTLANWRKRYSDFSEQINEAEGAAAVGWLAKIEKAANDNVWQAAAWKLERRYPEQYGRQVVTQQVTGRIIVDLDTPDKDGGA